MFGYYHLYFVMHKESLTGRKVLPFFNQTISLSNVTNRTLQIEKKMICVLVTVNEHMKNACRRENR